MVDPDEIAQIAASLRLIVLSVADAESDDRWQRAQAIVARHNDNETWQALRDYAESKIEEHKDDQFTGEATVWSTVLSIIKSVP